MPQWCARRPWTTKAHRWTRMVCSRCSMSHSRARERNDCMTRREDELLERLREATVALHRTLNERDALVLEKTEPIAIVGIGCRFPDGAAGPDAFWGLLEAGRDAVRPLDERWALVGAHP